MTARQSTIHTILVGLHLTWRKKTGSSAPLGIMSLGVIYESLSVVCHLHQQFTMAPSILDLDKMVLFGDSLTQRGFDTEQCGWAATLANCYIRKLDVVNRGFSGMGFPPNDMQCPLLNLINSCVSFQILAPLPNFLCTNPRAHHHLVFGRRTMIVPTNEHGLNMRH